MKEYDHSNQWLLDMKRHIKSPMYTCSNVGHKTEVQAPNSALSIRRSDPARLKVNEENYTTFTKTFLSVT